MKILSLFDGISCGRVALERAGIKVDKYYASEIDKYAMKISQKNYPDIIQIGDVTGLVVEDGWIFHNQNNDPIKNGGSFKGDIDLLIGGSPCQSFSIAGKQEGFEGKSGLFYEYVRILREVEPKYFLLENVKMKKEYQDVISKELGVEPIEINSSSLSAQNRKRLYRTNIPGITQPEDKGIIVNDILEDAVEEKYYLSELVFEKLKKFESNARLSPLEGKSYCLSTMQGGHRQPKILFEQRSDEGVRTFKNNKCGTVRCINSGGDKRVYDGRIRKLTPLECERLQTLPDGFSEGVSNSQRYKMIGNGWTVDVIAHILSFIK